MRHGGGGGGRAATTIRRSAVSPADAAETTCRDDDPPPQRNFDDDLRDVWDDDEAAAREARHAKLVLAFDRPSAAAARAAVAREASAETHARVQDPARYDTGPALDKLLRRAPVARFPRAHAAPPELRADALDAGRDPARYRVAWARRRVDKHSPAAAFGTTERAVGVSQAQAIASVALAQARHAAEAAAKRRRKAARRRARLNQSGAGNHVDVDGGDGGRQSDGDVDDAASDDTDSSVQHLLDAATQRATEYVQPGSGAKIREMVSAAFFDDSGPTAVRVRRAEVSVAQPSPTSGRRAAHRRAAEAKRALAAQKRHALAQQKELDAMTVLIAREGRVERVRQRWWLRVVAVAARSQRIAEKLRVTRGVRKTKSFFKARLFLELRVLTAWRAVVLNKKRWGAVLLVKLCLARAVRRRRLRKKVQAADVIDHFLCRVRDNAGLKGAMHRYLRRTRRVRAWMSARKAVSRAQRLVLQLQWRRCELTMRRRMLAQRLTLMGFSAPPLAAAPPHLWPYLVDGGRAAAEPLRARAWSWRAEVDALREKPLEGGAPPAITTAAAALAPAARAVEGNGDGNSDGDGDCDGASSVDSSIQGEREQAGRDAANAVEQGLVRQFPSWTEFTGRPGIAPHWQTRPPRSYVAGDRLRQRRGAVVLDVLALRNAARWAALSTELQHKLPEVPADEVASAVLKLWLRRRGAHARSWLRYTQRRRAWLDGLNVRIAMEERSVARRKGALTDDDRRRVRQRVYVQQKPTPPLFRVLCTKGEMRALVMQAMAAVAERLVPEGSGGSSDDDPDDGAVTQDAAETLGRSTPSRAALRSRHVEGESVASVIGS